MFVSPGRRLQDFVALVHKSGKHERSKASRNQPRAAFPARRQRRMPGHLSSKPAADHTSRFYVARGKLLGGLPAATTDLKTQDLPVRAVRGNS